MAPSLCCAAAAQNALPNVAASPLFGVGLGGTVFPPARALWPLSLPFSLSSNGILPRQTACPPPPRPPRANNLYGIPATAAQNCTCRALFPTEIVSPSFVVLGLMLHVKGTHPPYPIPYNLQVAAEEGCFFITLVQFTKVILECYYL